MLVHGIKLIFGIVIVVGALVLIHRRNESFRRLTDRFASRVTNRFGRRIQLNESFAGDVEAGLNSDNFDVLHHNEHDERNGLDDKAKNDIKKIMMDKNLSFDEARLSYMRDTFTEHGIAQDGTPKDPRTVTFARD